MDKIRQSIAADVHAAMALIEANKTAEPHHFGTRNRRVSVFKTGTVYHARCMRCRRSIIANGTETFGTATQGPCKVDG
jgi:hypothetical protein